MIRIEINVMNTFADKKPDGYSSHEKNRGWLKLFFLVIGVWGILTPKIGFTSVSLSDFDFEWGYWHTVIGPVCGGIMLVGLAVLAFYTIWSFYQTKPNAVFLGKAYLILLFITNFLIFMFVEDEQTRSDIFYILPNSLFWVVSWYLYLLFSKQVKTLFPKQKRKIHKRDVLFLFAMVSPLLIWCLIAIIFSMAEKSNFYTIHSFH